MDNIQILYLDQYLDQYSDNYMVSCIHVYFKIMCLCVYQKKKKTVGFLNKCIHLFSTTYIELYFFYLIFLTTLIFTNYIWDVK